MECSICGISDKMRNVSQALSQKGIIFVCDKCLQEEGFITLKKPRAIEEQGKETMYERMTRISGVVPKEIERHGAKIQEKSLKEIVDRNYEKKIKQEVVLKQRPDLVDNFHWIIMRIRRIKGLTQGQLAERINEPETAVKMAEQGVVPEGYNLVDKLERFLKVRLIKERKPDIHTQRQQQHLNQQLNKQSQQAKTLYFDRNALDSLTISDLKKMKQEREQQTEEKTEEDESSKENDLLGRRNYERLDYE